MIETIYDEPIFMNINHPIPSFLLLAEVTEVFYCVYLTKTVFVGELNQGNFPEAHLKPVLHSFPELGITPSSCCVA